MIWGISWTDQQMAPIVPRMLAAIGTSIINVMYQEVPGDYKGMREYDPCFREVGCKGPARWSARKVLARMRWLVLGETKKFVCISSKRPREIFARISGVSKYELRGREFSNTNLGKGSTSLPIDHPFSTTSHKSTRVFQPYARENRNVNPFGTFPVFKNHSSSVYTFISVKPSFHTVIYGVMPSSR